VTVCVFKALAQAPWHSLGTGFGTLAALVAVFMGRERARDQDD